MAYLGPAVKSTSRIAYGRIIKAFLLAGWRPPTMSDRAFERIVDSMRSVRPDAKLELSPRQLESVYLLSLGLNYQEIADELSISRESAKRHCHLVFSRLGAKNAAHAVAIAFRAGIIE
jgi:DNA-binding CsgD family transcriptional regulator